MLLYCLARYEIVEEIKRNSAIVLIGETGSGKTTQVPQFIYDILGKDPQFRGGIAVTQPRRIAAITVANRVADEMGVEVGGLVGYSVRFEEKTSPDTRIKFLTDGMLLRECMVSPDLKKYKYIILDEAHERSIQTDVLCSLVKLIQSKKRPDLKIIIMSATIEAELFEKYFQAKILYVEGRQFPVQILYSAKPENNYLDATVITALQIHLEEPSNGDILAFLTGREEIEDVSRILNEKAKHLPPNALKLIVCPLYAAQTTSQQKKAFEKTPQGCRKIIISTNIAETSITVPNIKYVIDAGLVKIKQRTNNIKIQQQARKVIGSDKVLNDSDSLSLGNISTDILAVVPISKAQAWQRAGRAGRTQPGKTYRLYTERFFLEKLKDSQIPEIKRVDLANLILQLLAVGIENIDTFPFIDPPKKKLMLSALESLYSLSAIDKKGRLTPLGKQMSLFPLEPTYSKVLIKSKELECTQEVLTVVSMLSVDNLFEVHSFSTDDEEKHTTAVEAEAIKRAYAMNFGDHILYLNIYNSFMKENKHTQKQWCKSNFVNYRAMLKVCDIRNQILKYWKDSAKMPLGEPLDVHVTSEEWKEKCEAVCKAFVTAFFKNVALLTHNGTYETLREKMKVQIHPGSSLFQSKARCVLYNELVYTSNFYMRDVLSIDRTWLLELAPEYFQKV